MLNKGKTFNEFLLLFNLLISIKISYFSKHIIFSYLALNSKAFKQIEKTRVIVNIYFKKIY